MSKPRVKQFNAGPCLSYLIYVEDEVILVDPHLNLVEEYRSTIKNNSRLVAIVETHTHADHLSAAKLLSDEFSVSVYVSPKSSVLYSHATLSEGENIVCGDLKIDVLETPGHTDDSLCLYCDGYLFSGDTLLVESIGRCDFQNGSPADMHDSLKKIDAMFSDDTIVYPGHSYGKKKQSTIGEERKNNPYFREKNRDTFVGMVTQKTIPKPADMDNIIRLNQSGAIQEVKLLSPEKVRDFVEADDCVFVDVRTVEEHFSISMHGSKNMPLQNIGAHFDELRVAGKKIIVTCRTGSRARTAANQMISAGIPDVYILDGSLVGWMKAGLPVLRQGPRFPLQQQVMMVAGSLVITGVVFSYVFSPLWVLLSLGVGCGLTFAGLSGTCLMGDLLLKMPWNKQPPKAGGGGCSLGGSGGGCSL